MKKSVMHALVAAVIAGTGGILSAAASGSGPEAMGPGSIEATYNVQPGLRVWYRRQCNIRHLNRMPEPEQFKREGETGEPVVIIDHSFGKGKIFDSNGYTKVCVLFEGLLFFKTPGTYTLKVLSNDGVRLFINDRQILDDPGIHSERWRLTPPLNVTEPGWYPLRIQYFQRKGTAALRLTWRLPGKEAYSVIPSEAYGHRTKL